MAILNLESIRSKVVNSNQLKALAAKNADRKFNAAHKELLNNIESNPLSQEIAKGPDGVTLGETVLRKGNLFSFIGFDAGSTPIKDLVEIYKEETTIDLENPVVKKSLDKVIYSFKVTLPSNDVLDQKAKMPFNTYAESWVTRIEKGISGLNSYIYHRYFKSNSHSGTGLQKDEAAGGTFKQQYLTPILEKFKNKIR